jgi:hypothetical protein
MVVPIIVTLKVKAAPRNISSGNQGCCLVEGMQGSWSAILKVGVLVFGLFTPDQ